jgi:hypothetical protein
VTTLHRPSAGWTGTIAAKRIDLSLNERDVVFGGQGNKRDRVITSVGGS